MSFDKTDRFFLDEQTTSEVEFDPLQKFGTSIDTVFSRLEPILESFQFEDIHVKDCQFICISGVQGVFILIECFGRHFSPKKLERHLRREVKWIVSDFRFPMKLTVAINFAKRI